MLIGREAFFFFFSQCQLAHAGFLTNGAVVYFTGYLPAHNFLRYPMQTEKRAQLTSSGARADSWAETTTVISALKR